MYISAAVEADNSASEERQSKTHSKTVTKTPERHISPHYAALIIFNLPLIQYL